MAAAPMPGTASEIHAKGSNFVGLLKALDDLHGLAARERVFDAMPEEVASALRFGQVVVMGWYPVDWYAQLHAALDHCFHGGPALARKLSYHSTRTDISGMHRFIASMLSVETVFGQSHRLMGLYWKGGTIERPEITPGRARVRFVGWTGFTPLIWEDIMGGMEAIAHACGPANARCRPSPRAPIEDTATLDIEVRWTF
jgi:hypothetical protein